MFKKLLLCLSLTAVLATGFNAISGYGQITITYYSDADYSRVVGQCHTTCDDVTACSGARSIWRDVTFVPCQ